MYTATFIRALSFKTRSQLCSLRWQTTARESPSQLPTTFGPRNLHTKPQNKEAVQQAARVSGDFSLLERFEGNYEPALWRENGFLPKIYISRTTLARTTIAPHCSDNVKKSTTRLALGTTIIRQAVQFFFGSGISLFFFLFGIFFWLGWVC